ncbi:MAG: hypothetical protein ACR2PZ_02630 [Pseudomonadales bacterium]
MSDLNNQPATTSAEITAIRAQAQLHHAYFLGLQLMVSTRKGPQVMGKWMFKLFRRQHLEKFLPSFDKLGLADLPHAVACAKYHVLSNNIGGVWVEYMAESERKAWVRFRYPRWMYAGPTLCGIPVEVSRGFLTGWYAHNGVSLGNPRLGFVCVSEDMTGEFGLCGYFREFEQELAPTERLQFAKTEAPPAFDPNEQPQPPADQWNELRLEKANRNYALEYVRNGLCELVDVIGNAEAKKLGSLAARLIGLQYYDQTRAMIEVADGDLGAAADYLCTMFTGMGDVAEQRAHGDEIELQHTGLRVIRGLTETESALVLECWAELWRGAMAAQRQLKTLSYERVGQDLRWHLALGMPAASQH